MSSETRFKLGDRVKLINSTLYGRIVELRGPLAPNRVQVQIPLMSKFARISWSLSPRKKTLLAARLTKSWKKSQFLRTITTELPAMPQMSVWRQYFRW
jgi:hypothetical protein